MLKVESKYKICKRLGSEVFEKCQTQKFTLAEARAAANKKRGRKNQSDYGRRLLQKQKLRYAYGLYERQLRRYVEDAKRTGSANPTERLYQLLEMRLDNVVYRMGLAPTRRMARQLVSHGHVLVNKRKSTVPSHALSVSDVISVREGSKTKGPFLVQDEKETSAVPGWISINEKDLSATIKSVPALVPGESPFDFVQILEFYSR